MTIDRREGRSRMFLQQQHLLLGYVFALVGDRSDAEDILQEVGVVALTRAEAPDEPAAFSAWCRGVARNLVLHHWRTKRRRPQAAPEALFDLADQAYAEADQHSDAWERQRRALARCFERLGSHARDLLSWRYVDDLSADEIARRQGKTGVSVRMKLMRIRKALLRCMDRSTEATTS